MRNSFYILTLLILSLACASNSQLPTLPTATPTATPDRYEVTAETLRIRNGAGEEYTIIGSLSYGQVVTCYTIQPAKDGGRWCEHEIGWSNIRYMKGK